jgi:radical SAM superfamily enzyme YgiQ (UPF0313 family)
MSSLGYLWVYRFLAQSGQALGERFFALDPPQGRPLSLESRRPLGGFDLIAASLVFENDYWLLLDVLARAGIPPERAARGGGPLVLAGGVGVWSNPWPLMPFADLILAGEGEAQWPRLAGLFRDPWFLGLGHLERLAHVQASVPGALAPALLPEGPDGWRSAPPVRPAFLDWPFGPSEVPPASPILSRRTEFPETTLVEISRGCPWGCRFCLAGALYRPHRPWTAEAVLEAAASMRPTGGRVGLVSPAVADHPGLSAIFDGLAERGASVGVSSMRLSALTEPLARRLSGAGLKALAVAPEAGSQGLRDAINKNLSEPEILESAAQLSAIGQRRHKLYFNIGLPGETPGDLEALAGLVARIAKAARARGGGPRIAVSLSNFTPKPHTPFEGQPLPDEASMRRSGRLATGLLSRLGGLEVRLDPPKWTIVQGLLARGGPESGFLVKALLEARGRPGPALRLAGYRESSPAHRPWEGPRPWRIVAPRAGLPYLAEEGRLAVLGRPSPPCPAGGGCGRCQACGPAGQDGCQPG